MKFACKMMALLICVGLLMGCTPSEAEPSPSPSPEGESQMVEAMKTVVSLLDEGDVQGALSYFSPTVEGFVSEDQLSEGWTSVTEAYGALVSVGEAQETGNVVQLLLEFETTRLYLICSFAQDGGMTSLYFQSAEDYTEQNNWVMPDGVTEETVIIGEGTEMEITGTITLPMGEGPFPAVVLVHGSGSADGDETIGANKPFMDLAYGLAERGIAVIRYDKASYAHPEAFLDGDYTIDDEYTGTVLAALTALKENTPVDRVYLLGHSMGGLLGPYLMAAADGGFDGGIFLAGTPRKLWEVIVDQNLAVIAQMPEESQGTYLDQVEEQRQLALDNDGTGEETIFGMPAAYLYHLDQIDPIAIARELQLPLLILQGDADFQVTAETDYAAWQAGLGDLGGLVSYKLYEGLNHLMMESGGEHQGTAEEYNEPRHVSAEVLDDIMAWIYDQ